MLYLDTSALLKLYLLEEGSRSVQDRVAAQDHPLPVWEVQQMELVNALWLKVFWKETDSGAAENQIRLFGERCRRGLYFFPEIRRSDLMDCFLGLSRETARLGCRTMDILHVAFALTIGAGEFLTFDKRQAGLAAAAGLAVSVLKTG